MFVIVILYFKIDLKNSFISYQRLGSGREKENKLEVLTKGHSENTLGNREQQKLFH